MAKRESSPLRCYFGVFHALAKATGVEPFAEPNRVRDLVFSRTVTCAIMGLMLIGIHATEIGQELDWFRVLEDTFALVTMGGAMLSSWLNSSAQRGVYRRLRALDLSCAPLGILPARRHVFGKLVIFVYFLCPLVLTASLLAFRSLYYLRTAYFFYGHFLRSVFAVQFLAGVHQIGLRLSPLNDHLRFLGTREGVRSYVFVDLKRQLRLINELHVGLRKVVGCLNRCHGAQIIILTVSTVIENMAIAAGIDSSDFRSLSLKHANRILSTTQILILVYACESTSYKASRTPGLMHRLMNVPTESEFKHSLLLNSMFYAHDTMKFSALDILPMTASTVVYAYTPVLTYAWVVVNGRL